MCYDSDPEIWLYRARLLREWLEVRARIPFEQKGMHRGATAKERPSRLLGKRLGMRPPL